MTPFRRVKAWTEDVKIQGIRGVTSLPDILTLNSALIEEESGELLGEISALEHRVLMGEELNVRPGIVKIAKELADTIIVCNHLFSQLGLDGDVVTCIVADNNDKKIVNPSRHVNELGKIVLSPEAKAELKREVTRNLDEYVSRVFKD